MHFSASYILQRRHMCARLSTCQGRTRRTPRPSRWGNRRGGSGGRAPTRGRHSSREQAWNMKREKRGIDNRSVQANVYITQNFGQNDRMVQKCLARQIKRVLSNKNYWISREVWIRWDFGWGKTSLTMCVRKTQNYHKWHQTFRNVWKLLTCKSPEKSWERCLNWKPEQGGTGSPTRCPWGRSRWSAPRSRWCLGPTTNSPANVTAYLMWKHCYHTKSNQSLKILIERKRAGNPTRGKDPKRLDD